jgi:magnesium-transporting ATPase (P-type)
MVFESSITITLIPERLAVSLTLMVSLPLARMRHRAPLTGSRRKFDSAAILDDRISARLCRNHKFGGIFNGISED